MRLALEFTVVSTVLNIEFFYLIRVDKMASIFYCYDQNTIYLNTIFSLYSSKLNACIQEETFLSYLSFLSVLVAQ